MTESQSLRAVIDAAIAAGAAVDALPPTDGDPAAETTLADLVEREAFARRDLMRRIQPLAGDGGSVAYLLPDGTVIAYTDRPDGLVIARPDRVFRLEELPS